ncbi:hypothetical protein EYM_06355 [Ignicoccus islandicus DSM 13165]|uniref:Uncharacterized protein n=1 Tax=Ignicoccus islandicus DSM 13165 TaxID=940295 RepID=A0A0U3FAH9_9CREN|nr:hypothetical protein [Ignicoccus islandicus]ALU12681.1 hypothetical protein EYM_06355 [Ignicoccus islandicus DSM 13165]
MKLDVNFGKMIEEFRKSFKPKTTQKKGIPLYLRKCKYCKYIELTYCKYHAVTIHPESRACPAFSLQEKYLEAYQKGTTPQEAQL